MKTRLIRILGTVLSVFGVTTTVNASNTGICKNPTKRGLSNYDAHEVVKYTIDTGSAWFVAWPNKDYSGDADTMPWGSLSYFSLEKTFNGHTFYSIALEPSVAYTQMPDLSGYCGPAVEPGVTAFDLMTGTVAGRNICVKGDSYTFYSAQTGVFGYFGCCYTGYITTGTSTSPDSSSTGSGSSGYSEASVSLADCPCIYREADGSGHYDSDYGEIVTHEVVEQIRTYEFINCSPGYYQPTDANGNSTTVNSGYSGKTVFKIHPGFGWSTSFDYAAADPCEIPDNGTSNSIEYCKNNGCTQTETNGWFGGYVVGACRACPNSSSDVSGPTEYGELVFAETLSGSGLALFSTVGINSCKLDSYKVTDSNGTLEYDCNSTYQ